MTEVPIISWWRFLSYPIISYPYHFQSKSMDWYLCDMDLSHERVKILNMYCRYNLLINFVHNDEKWPKILWYVWSILICLVNMHERVKSWYPFIDDIYFSHEYPTFTKVTEVNEWSTCSTTCGNGKQYRVIPCPMPSTECTPIQEWKDCNAGICDNSKKVVFAQVIFS